MASKMIGRAACPECGFESAHVKESEKCLYRYCPECGSQHYAKSQRQRADLTAKTRITAAPTASTTEEPKAKPAPPIVDATPTPTASDATPTPSPATEPPRRRGLFS
jgi:hypothetical protein